ncbi:MAG: FIST N-terminal domain-containing protein [Pseudomonadota bacterium]
MARDGTTLTNCGIRVAGTRDTSTCAAIRHLSRQIGTNDIQHLIVLFSGDHDAQSVCRELESAFPQVPYSGCTTAGEFGPHGMSTGGIVAVAFPKHGFQICSEVIQDIDQFGVERATNTVRSLRSKLLDNHSPATAARISDRASVENRVFALLLVDGLSKFEEMLVAAINWAIGDLQLIGGSSADQLSRGENLLIQNGRVLNNAALLLLVETSFPFKAFRTQDFIPSDRKLVVTAADAEQRLVYELNAEPAAHEYARCIGQMPADLDHNMFASFPLGVRIGDEHYCRSVRSANTDGSLSFFCAIDEGLVLTLAQRNDVVSATEQTFKDLDQALGGLDLVIGFDCVLRRLDAEQRQMRHLLENTYQKHRIVGFHTYGEQFNAMHLNQTLTGIAFGSGNRVV